MHSRIFVISKEPTAPSENQTEFEDLYHAEGSFYDYVDSESAFDYDVDWLKTVDGICVQHEGDLVKITFDKQKYFEGKYKEFNFDDEFGFHINVESSDYSLDEFVRCMKNNVETYYIVGSLDYHF